MSHQPEAFSPETLYDQLEDPQTTDTLVAVAGLRKVLGIEDPAAYLPELNEAVMARTVASAEEPERDEREVGRRIIGILHDYPWLQPTPIPGQKGITARDLSIWTGNHLFDNYPALFGITKNEAESFRAMMENSFGTPEYQRLCEDIGVTFEE